MALIEVPDDAAAEARAALAGVPALPAPRPWWCRVVLRHLAASAAKRPPDREIGSEGSVYLHRWHLIPRNRWCNAYLHLFHRSDDDRALHDHPWRSLSVVLAGGYLEHVPHPLAGRAGTVFEKGDTRAAWRGPGSLVPRRAEAAHRVELLPGSGPVWTLFLTGPRAREWGFHCPRGWRHWREFTAGPNGESAGKGCD